MSATKPYSRKELTNLKESIPMELLVEALGGEIHSYSSRGGWTSVSCPIHGDENPSAGISPDGTGFHCFGCGVRGDIFAIVQAAGEARSFREAVAWVTKRWAE
jgi:DNA primase